MVSDYKAEHELNMKSYRWRSIKSWNQLPLDTVLIKRYKKRTIGTTV